MAMPIPEVQQFSLADVLGNAAKIRAFQNEAAAQEFRLGEEQRKRRVAERLRLLAERPGFDPLSKEGSREIMSLDFPAGITLAEAQAKLEAARERTAMARQQQQGVFAPVPIMRDGKVFYAFPDRTGQITPTDFERPPESAVVNTDRGQFVIPKVPGAQAQPAMNAGNPLFAPPKQEYSPESGMAVTLPAPGSNQAPTAAPVTQPKAALEMEVKNRANSGRVLDLLGTGDPNDPLTANVNQAIRAATGSGAGALMDKAAGFFGRSTTGATANAPLKVLEGRIIAMMPRMEGPQSDRDIELYRAMAGKIGDPSTPTDQKLMAIGEVRRLARQYAHMQPAAAPAGQPPRPAGPSMKWQQSNKGNWREVPQ